LIRAGWRATLRRVPPELADRVFQSWVNVAAERRDAAAALRELFALEDHLQREIDRTAIRYDDGVHVKHRLTHYHDFFVERISPGERVLDIGSGKGELAHDLALRAGAHVTGIDVKGPSLAFARERFRHEHVRFLERDALEALPEGPFDVVVLSNVIEHLEARLDLLRRIARELRPRCVLIRVPAEDRHWHVPLRRELGLAWFSDPTHVVEYDHERLLAELDEAGLQPVEVQTRWGELWVEARPALDG
jgi:2-polyprenyl-3-methyl-5-hydroxy-6-metoxy-1,4-benzoquinol methylase